MEITNDIKAKVFAPYIGQKLEYRNQELNDYLFHQIHIGNLNGEKLILKPLSAITDEDAIEVAKIEGLAMAQSRRNKFKVILQDDSYTMYINFSGQITIYKYKDPFNLVKPFAIYQYLQSKGYDLPHYLLGGQTLHSSGLATYNNLK